MHMKATIYTTIQSLSKDIVEQQFFKGDIYIPTQQKGIRYIIEFLEPEATDSFFNWNFLIQFYNKKKGILLMIF